MFNSQTGDLAQFSARLSRASEACPKAFPLLFLPYFGAPSYRVAQKPKGDLAQFSAPKRTGNLAQFSARLARGFEACRSIVVRIFAAVLLIFPTGNLAQFSARLARGFEACRSIVVSILLLLY